MKHDKIKIIMLVMILSAASYTMLTSISKDNKHAPEQIAQQRWSDSLINARVREQLISHKLFENNNPKGYPISVTTVHGTVYLSGTVENDQQLNTAIDLAQNTPGVKKVLTAIVRKPKHT